MLSYTASYVLMLINDRGTMSDLWRTCHVRPSVAGAWQASAPLKALQKGCLEAHENIQYEWEYLCICTYIYICMYTNVSMLNTILLIYFLYIYICIYIYVYYNYIYIYTYHIMCQQSLVSWPTQPDCSKSSWMKWSWKSWLLRHIFPPPRPHVSPIPNANHKNFTVVTVVGAREH